MDYGKLTKKELIELLEEREIAYSSSKTKQQLEDLLLERDSQSFKKNEEINNDTEIQMYEEPLIGEPLKGAKFFKVLSLIGLIIYGIFGIIALIFEANMGFSVNMLITIGVILFIALPSILTFISMNRYIHNSSKYKFAHVMATIIVVFSIISFISELIFILSTTSDPNWYVTGQGWTSFVISGVMALGYSINYKKIKLHKIS